MKKVLLSIALVFAIAATSSVMAQEEKKECSKQKTECAKKCEKSEEKKCCKSDEKKCAKEADKKCCKDNKQTSGKN